MSADQDPYVTGPRCQDDLWAFRSRMDSPPYCDRQGRTISVERWAQLHNDISYILVAQAQVQERYLVSAMWMGLMPPDPPVVSVFASMGAFELEVSNIGTREVLLRRCYFTEEAADVAHEEITRGIAALLREGREESEWAKCL